MREVILYTRVGCHLCEDVQVALDRVRSDTPFALSVIDIDTDPALIERYGLEIPVVVVDGRKHAKYHLDEAAFRRRLAASD